MFEIGSRVRVVKDTTPDGSLADFVGMTGVVTHDMIYIKVSFDAVANDWCFVPDELELIEAQS